MQIAANTLSVYSPSPEEKVISEMEKTRSELISLQSDPLKDNSRFKNAKDSYGKLRENLNQLRTKSGDQEKSASNRRSALNTYLERRLFNDEFPDDAKRLQTYQVYTSAGRKASFSFSALEYVGTRVNAVV